MELSQKFRQKLSIFESYQAHCSMAPILLGTLFNVLDAGEVSAQVQNYRYTKTTSVDWLVDISIWAKRTNLQQSADARNVHVCDEVGTSATL